MLVKTDSAFNGCISLTSLDLSSFNFSSVKDANYMFSHCESLEYLALPDQMSSLLDISGMFSYCFNLTSINLGFLENATKVQNLFNMFYYCQNLIEVEFPYVHIDFLNSSSQMFSDCMEIKRIDLGKLEIRNVSVMNNMFRNCKNLEFLNITNFDMRFVTSYDSIFLGVPKNISIIYDSNKTSKIMEEIIKNQSLEK